MNSSSINSPYRRIGCRMHPDVGDHLSGAVLRHLSASTVEAMADPTSRLPHDCRHLVDVTDRHGSDGDLPASRRAAERKTQMRRGLDGPGRRTVLRHLPRRRPPRRAAVADARRLRSHRCHALPRYSVTRGVSQPRTRPRLVCVCGANRLWVVARGG